LSDVFSRAAVIEYLRIDRISLYFPLLTEQVFLSLPPNVESDHFHLQTTLPDIVLGNVDSSRDNDVSAANVSLLSVHVDVK
jgi:hypothetical protein